MEITDEMVGAARNSLIESNGRIYFPSKHQVRAALEAALGARKTKIDYLKSATCIEEIRERDAACIEDLAAALKTLAAYDDKYANQRLKDTGLFTYFDSPQDVELARATLERWGLK